MINKKEAEVMVLRWELPKGYDWFEQRFCYKKSVLGELRRKHMIELKARGVMVSQIARVYHLTRQRTHKIIKG